MNEKIRQLAVEAGFYASPDVEKFAKFAELIIQECAGVAYDTCYACDYERDWVIRDAIKQHFGMEG